MCCHPAIWRCRQDTANDRVCSEGRKEKLGSRGELYWLPAHGNRDRLIHSLAHCAGSLLNVQLNDYEKQDLDLILSLLKRKLKSTKGKWLLCIDNADDPSTNRVIGDLCGLSLIGSENGWILVTSLHGGSIMWPGMVSSQKLPLSPLYLTRAMITLYHYKCEHQHTKISDVQEAEKLRKLRFESRNEFLALKDLSGSKKPLGLGGLSLALAQAGRFIHRRRISFRE